MTPFYVAFGDIADVGVIIDPEAVRDGVGIPCLVGAINMAVAAPLAALTREIAVASGDVAIDSETRKFILATKV